MKKTRIIFDHFQRIINDSTLREKKASVGRYERREMIVLQTYYLQVVYRIVKKCLYPFYLDK